MYKLYHFYFMFFDITMNKSEEVKSFTVKVLVMQR